MHSVTPSRNKEKSKLIVLTNSTYVLRFLLHLRQCHVNMHPKDSMIQYPTNLNTASVDRFGARFDDCTLFHSVSVVMRMSLKLLTLWRRVCESC